MTKFEKSDLERLWAKWWWKLITQWTKNIKWKKVFYERLKLTAMAIANEIDDIVFKEYFYWLDSSSNRKFINDVANALWVDTKEETFHSDLLHQLWATNEQIFKILWNSSTRINQIVNVGKFCETFITIWENPSFRENILIKMRKINHNRWFFWIFLEELREQEIAQEFIKYIDNLEYDKVSYLINFFKKYFCNWQNNDMLEIFTKLFNWDINAANKYYDNFLNVSNKRIRLFMWHSDYEWKHRANKTHIYSTNQPLIFFK